MNYSSKLNVAISTEQFKIKLLDGHWHYKLVKRICKYPTIILSKEHFALFRQGNRIL